MCYSKDFPPQEGDIVYTPVDGKKHKYLKGTIVGILSDEEVLVEVGSTIYKDKVSDLAFVRAKSERKSFWQRLFGK